MNHPRSVRLGDAPAGAADAPPSESSQPIRLHLRAACLSVGSLAVLLGTFISGSAWSEKHWIHALAPQTSVLKNQGTALQRAAFAESDLLPLYGSSELIKRVPDKAGLFFVNHPSDFTVSPTGRPGCTTLIMLQKIAASAEAARGHKVAVILSPSWFFVPRPNERGYAGNFSLLQSSRLLFRGDLSWGLKRDIARRLEDYPETLEGAPFVASAIHHTATGSPADRWLVTAMYPLGWMRNALAGIEDHWTAVKTIWEQRRRLVIASHSKEPLPWADLLQEADGLVKNSADDRPDGRPRLFASDAAFRQALEGAQEWGDLELLLRTLRELGLDPLLITIPIESRHFEERGISRASVDAYEQRLSALASRYRIPLATFSDHGDDGKFFADHHDHLSAKGWMYLDKTIDDFYHAPRRHFHPRRLHSESARSNEAQG